MNLFFNTSWFQVRVHSAYVYTECLVDRVKDREMASTSEVNIEQLKKEVTCQKCHKLYSSPKLLPCLHTFCKGCLTLRDGLRDKEGLKFVVDCPKCSETTEVSARYVIKACTK